VEPVRITGAIRFTSSIVGQLNDATMAAMVFSAATYEDLGGP